MVKASTIYRTMTIIAAVVFTFGALAQGAWSQSPSKNLILVKGIIVGGGLIEKWGKEFQGSATPGRSVLFQPCMNDEALQAIIDGQASMALTARKMTPEEDRRASEKGVKLVGQLVGYAGPAVITCTRNPVNELTVDQVSQIFGGRCASWKQVGGPDEPIRVLVKNPGASEAAKMFRKFVLRGETFSPHGVILSSFATTAHIVSRAKDLPVGFMPSSVLDTWLQVHKHGDIKVLALKKVADAPGVMPSLKTFQDHSYPVSVVLYLYWNQATTNPASRAFAEFCAGKGAKALSSSER
jgi:phosphate transport system substrate-binding protein